MAWNPSSNFRFDIGYVGQVDFHTDISKLPHFDLTHLGIWSKSVLSEQGWVQAHADEVAKQTSDALWSNPFILFINAVAHPCILNDFKQNLDEVIQTALDNLHNATTEYIKSHGGDVKKILEDEQQNRFENGAIVYGDLTSGNIESLRTEHPEADYDGRVDWILKNLRPIRVIFKEDWTYWEGIKNLLR